MKHKCTLLLTALLVLAAFLNSSAASTRSIAHSVSETGVSMLNNPAAVYCTDVLGYEYQIIEDSTGGQMGICILQEGESCEQWDFYAGTCGQEHGYCARNDYRTETRSDSQDPYSPTYAVCVSSNGQVLGTVAELADLQTHAAGPGELGPQSVSQSEDIAIEDGTEVLDPSVPSSFDWRSYQGHNWLTPVKNQAGCGSCWAFAAMGVAEAHHNIISSNPGLDLNLSEQELVSCSGAGSCSGGSSSLAMQYMRDSGIVDEACFPYTASDSSCSRCSGWQNRRAYLDEVHSFSPSQSSIKQNVVTYGPIYVYMGIGTGYGGYFDGSGVYRCSNDSQNGNNGINHAVVIVGYQDSGSYWIVRNSWGSSYDGDGYFKVGYGECNIDRTSAGYAYLVPPVTTYSLSGTTGGGDWYLSEVRVTLNANEPVQWTQYRIDGGTWKTYSSPFTITSDGVHILEYRSRDIFGAEESTRSTTVKIDRTAPDNPNSVSPGCGAQNNIWQNTCTNPAFTWSGASDHGGSGVKDYHVYWGIDSNGVPNLWLSSANYNPVPITTSDGIATYYLRIATRDNLGHESSPTTLFTLRYDSTTPTVNPLVADDADAVHALEIVIEPRAQDTGSGPTTTYLSNDGLSWHSEAYADSTTWRLQPLNRQLQAVYLEVEDGASNRSERQICLVCLDLYPPHPSSRSYRLWSAGPIAAGGSLASSSYRLSSTTGQSTRGGILSSSNYRLRSGFQAMWPSSPGEEMFIAFSCWQRLYLPVVWRSTN